MDVPYSGSSYSVDKLTAHERNDSNINSPRSQSCLSISSISSDDTDTVLKRIPFGLSVMASSTTFVTLMPKRSKNGS